MKIKEEVLRRELLRQETQNIQSSLVEELVKETTSKSDEDEVIVDILEYVRAEWGLSENPYPIQRFLLKLIFGLKLDDRPDDLITCVVSPVEFKCMRVGQFHKFRNLDIGENKCLHANKVNIQKNTVILDKDPLIPLKVGDWVTARIEVWDKFRENLEGVYTESEFFDFLYADGPGTENCRISLSRQEYEQRLGKQMNLVVTRIGRRGTKSSIAQMIVAYFCYKILKKYRPQEYYQVKRDQAITMTLIATGKDQAQDLLAPARAAIKRSPYLKRYVDLDSSRRLLLNTPYNIDHGLDAESGIKVTALPCSAKATRGPANLLGLLEEFGFYYSQLSDAGSNTSDKEIYSAIAPSTSDLCNPDTGEPEGLVMILSTPLTTESYMHEIEESIWERTSELTNSLVIHLPSFWTNPLISPVKLREYYNLDPSTFWREFGANYSEQREKAFRPEVIEYCRRDPGNGHEWIRPGEQTFLGLDLAFLRDASAISVITMDHEGFARLILQEWIMYRVSPGWEEYFNEERGNCLDIEKIAKRVDLLWSQFGIRAGLADQWESFGFQALLNSQARSGIEFMHATGPKNDEIARNFISYVNNANIEIYAPESDWKDYNSLIKEIARLQRIETGGSIPKLELRAPNLKGAHDDRYSSLSRALFIAQKSILEQPPAAPIPRKVIERANAVRNRLESVRDSQRGVIRTGRPVTANTQRRFLK